MGGVREDQGTGTLGKAIAVLDAVANAETPMRFTDLLGVLDQPRGTLHRQISNLVDEGLLSTRPDHSYELGLRLLRFAAQAWSGNHFRSIAEPHLRALYQQVGETIHLGVLQGTEVIYLDKVEARQTVRMYSQVGNASPAYCTGVGKAALSLMPEPELSALVKRIQFNPLTPSTLKSASSLIDEIEVIRRDGVAYDREEHELGVHCIAAPIGVAGRNFYAGISVTAPVYRVGMDKLMDWRPEVASAAMAITEDVKLRMGPRG